MNIIETHDLCKQYGNALRVAHLDLDVPEGSVYGFLGPNGAGKSTTLKMILGLVRPTAGDIRVLGKKMDGGNRLAVLRQVGSLIESPSYYGHLTGEENLRIVQTLRGVPEKNIREVLQIVRLDGQRGKKLAHYSLGMKQRLGLAAALLGCAGARLLLDPLLAGGASPGQLPAAIGSSLALFLPLCRLSGCAKKADWQTLRRLLGKPERPPKGRAK